MPPSWTIVPPYCDMDLDQHQLRLGLVAWRHQTITWSYVGLSTLMSYGNYIRLISQGIPSVIFCVKSLEYYTFKITDIPPIGLRIGLYYCVLYMFALFFRWALKTFTIFVQFMMTSSNWNIFRVTGHLCGAFTGHRWIPRTKASDAELWCFLWSAPE